MIMRVCIALGSCCYDYSSLYCLRFWLLWLCECVLPLVLPIFCSLHCVYKSPLPFDVSCFYHQTIRNSNSRCSGKSGIGLLKGLRSGITAIHLLTWFLLTNEGHQNLLHCSGPVADPGHPRMAWPSPLKPKLSE